MEDTLAEETINQLFSGLYTIIKATLRQPLTSIKQETFKAELLSYKWVLNLLFYLYTCINVLFNIVILGKYKWVFSVTFYFLYDYYIILYYFDN